MIVAVDPGVRNTGVVVWDGGRVIRAYTITYKEPVATQYEIARMANRIISQLDETAWLADCMVIEGFEYLGGAFHASSLKTAFLVGALMGHYPGAVWQTSAQVLNPHRKRNTAYIKEHPETVPGGEKCTNDHERSALAHLVYHLNDKEGRLF